MIYAFQDIAIRSSIEDPFSVQLQHPYPDTYKPTWNEFMDALARQIQCSWKYDFKTGYWIFENEIMEYPFELDIAENWTKRDQGNHVVYIPNIAPVGMDVYMMGHYSADDEASLENIYTEAKKHVSRLIAIRFNPSLTDEDFSLAEVAGTDALFFTSPVPNKPNLIWRQWVLVKNGSCFMIVSVMDKDNEKALLTSVKEMVKSFSVK
jgi:hypothetical protein